MINKTITIMKRTISVLSVALFLGALLITSCSSEEKKVQRQSLMARFSGVIGVIDLPVEKRAMVI